MNVPSSGSAEQPDDYLAEQWQAIETFIAQTTEDTRRQLTYLDGAASFAWAETSHEVRRDLDKTMDNNAKMLCEALGALATRLGAKLLVASPESPAIYGSLEDIKFDHDSLAYQVSVARNPNNTRDLEKWSLFSASQVRFQQLNTPSTLRPLAPVSKQLPELPQTYWRPR